MFDFFKEAYLESKGLDVEKIKAEKISGREMKKKDKFIFSGNTKIIVYIFGIIYLLITGLNIFLVKESVEINAYGFVHYVFLPICDIAALISLAIKNKRAEIVALILILAFIIVQYLGIFL